MWKKGKGALMNRIELAARVLLQTGKQQDVYFACGVCGFYALSAIGKGKAAYNLKSTIRGAFYQ